MLPTLKSPIPAVRAAVTLISLVLAVVATAKPGKEANLLKQADFSKLKSVPELPSPWQTTAKSAGITVRMVNAKATPATWVQLKDESTEAAASMRQTFAAVPKGRFSVYVLAHAEHKGGIGIYLGTGTAIATADRVIDIKTSDDGAFRLGSRAKRKDTGLPLKPGSFVRVWVAWEPGSDGSLDVRFGAFDAQGKDVLVAQFSVADPAPITALRITSDTSAAGAHFLVSEPRIEPL